MKFYKSVDEVINAFLLDPEIKIQQQDLADPVFYAVDKQLCIPKLLTVVQSTEGGEWYYKPTPSFMRKFAIRGFFLRCQKLRKKLG